MKKLIIKGHNMEYSPEVVFHNLEASEFVERAALDKVDKLVQLFPVIIHCRVVIEAPHRSQQQGQIYQVRLIIKVPKSEIIVSQHTGKHGQHEDVYVALRDAFDAAKQKLQNYREKMNRQVKYHEDMPQGKIVKIFPQQGFGFIQTSDNQEVYFDQNSVIDFDFEKLDVGQRVRFAMEAGEEGPQASSLYVSKKGR